MKNRIIFDPHWRTLDELFHADDLAHLQQDFDVVWAKDAPIPADILAAALPNATVYIAATPHVDAAVLDAAPHLKMVIEVSGAFPETIDYAACAARGVEVLSCAPGFREGVAEMALAMALAGARGLVAEHEAFRAGQERWLDDHVARDFTLFDANVGFIGFGQIGQQIATLLAPFRPVISAYDPWLPVEIAHSYAADMMELHDVMARSDIVFVAAAPTRENRGAVDAACLAHVRDGALVVVISRAHLVDFPALLAEVASGRIRAAIDVFPHEPVPQDDPLRDMPGLILSPHRAAAVNGGRHMIGRLIRQDLDALMSGVATRALQIGTPERIAQMAGVGDATSVAAMAAERDEQ